MPDVGFRLGKGELGCRGSNSALAHTANNHEQDL